MCLVLHSGTATEETERSNHLCDQTWPTSGSTVQYKQTETSSVYGRGLPSAEVRGKPWGEVTISKPGGTEERRSSGGEKSGNV